jgi:hypothetical protein
VATSVGVGLPEGTGVAARDVAADGLADASDGVVVGVDEAVSALFWVTLTSASFW